MKFDHDFTGREALEQMAEPTRKKVTLAWNGEDVANAMGTMFQKDNRAKYIDLPLSNYSTWPNDKVLKDGEMVGVSTFSGYSSNESSMLSLAIVDVDRASRAPRSRSSGARRAAARRSPSSSATCRRRSAPSSLRSRTRRSSATRTGHTSACPATSSLLGLYWTVSGPVEVHVGREWSLFDWADRCAEAEKVGFSGLGIWHADLQHVLETRSLQEMKQVFDDNGLRHLELEFLMDWFLDEDDERRVASDEIRAAALRRRRRARRAPHQGRQHPRHRRPSSRV